MPRKRASKRRGNREGSVYKRTDGRWAGAISVGGGRTQQHRRYVYGRTREEAARKLHELQQRAKTGTLPSDARITVSQFASQWLEEKRHTVKESTLNDYEMVVRVHVTPALGGQRLIKLAPPDIQRWYSGLLAKGLSPTSVKDYSARLRAMLERAVELDLISKNPVKAAKLPRQERRQLPEVSITDINNLLHAALGHDLEALLVLSVTTGARQGEMLALRWNRVDLDRREIRVDKTLKRRSGGGFYLEEPKTAASERTIGLTGAAVRALSKRRAVQAEESLRMGPIWKNEFDLVFTTNVGTPISSANLTSRVLPVWLQAAGLPPLRWHDLRHVAASMLLGEGVAPADVSALLGHASVAVTHHIYAHAIRGHQQRTSAAMEKILAS